MGQSLKSVFWSAAPELSGAELGDVRRTRRLMSIVRRVQRCPSATFPRAMGSTSELEALYRFTTNMSFSAEDILAPHFSGSVERARGQDEVLVLHDSSDVLYGGESRREGLGPASAASNQGFLLHASLLCSADGQRTPLGLAALETITRAHKPFRPKKRLRPELHDPNRQSLRWGRGVETVESRLQRPHKAIHVMDASGDMYDLLQQLCDSDVRFVIRVSYPNRVVKTPKAFERLFARCSTRPRFGANGAACASPAAGASVLCKRSGAILRALRALRPWRFRAPSSSCSSRRTRDGRRRAQA